MIRKNLFLFQDYARQYGMRKALRRSLYKLFGCFPSEATEAGLRSHGRSSEDSAARRVPGVGPRFEALLKAGLDLHDVHNIKDPVKSLWAGFALSTAQRGEEIRRLVSRYTAIKGKRFLDVGCGHGGFLLAFTRAGADAVGIEICPGFLEYCRALAEDNNEDLTYYQMDVLDGAALASLGSFDIITCNDVIEHVDHPETAMANMTNLLNQGGLLFMQIPNRFSASFMRSDGHFGLFGITVLPKWMADRYHGMFYRPPHQVLYKSLGYYVNTLKGLGLRCDVIDPPVDNVMARLDETRGTLEECLRLTDGGDQDAPPEMRGKIRERISTLAGIFARQYEQHRSLRTADAAAAAALAGRLLRTFGTDFWQLVARK